MATDEIKQVVSIQADLTKIRSDLNTLKGDFKSSFAEIQSIGSSALGLFGIGFGLGGLVSGAKSVLALADELQNLSEQTKISVQLLSGIKSPLEEAGSSLDAFARGVFNLQKNLGNVDDDNDKVALSLKRLGLTLDELRNASPDEFIKKVTDALAKISNPVERNTLLFNLLGKNAKELGPAFEALTGKIDEYKKSGLRPEDVKVLDDFGDGITRLTNKFQLIMVTGISVVIRGLKELNLIFRNAIPGLRPPESLLGVPADFFNNLGKPKDDPFKGLGGGSKAKDLTKDLANLADAIGKTNDGLQEQLVELLKGKAAAEDYRLAAKENEEGQKGLTSAIVREQDRRRALTAQLREEIQARSDLAGVVRAETLQKGPQEDTRGLLNFEERKQAQEALDKLDEDDRKKLEESIKHLADLKEKSAQDEFKRIQDEANKTSQVWDDLGDGVVHAWDQMLDGVFQGTQDWGKLWQNLLRNIAIGGAQEISRAFIKQGVGALFGSTGGASFGFGSAPAGVEGPSMANGGFFSNILGAIGGLFMADGGVVTRPTFAMIGEAGPEAVIPLSQLKSGSSGITMNFGNIDARGAQRGVSTEIRQAIAEAKAEAIKAAPGAVATERKRSSNYAKTFK